MNQMQGVDEQSRDSGFESVEPSAKASVLDQHVQCVYYACNMLYFDILIDYKRLDSFFFLNTNQRPYLCIYVF